MDQLLTGGKLSRRARAFLCQHLQQLPRRLTEEEMICADLLDLQLR
jgi:hypothetical protein